MTCHSIYTHMESVKIPQNVRVEDKIVGPFSIKQLILMGIGGGFSYALFASIKSTAGTIPFTAHLLIWWPAILSAAFALIRINDISLFRYCILIVEMFSRPRKRVWQPRQGIIINIQTRKTSSPLKKAQEKFLRKKKQAPKEGEVPPATVPGIRELSILLDQGGEEEKTPVHSTFAVDPLERSVDSLHHQS